MALNLGDAFSIDDLVRVARRESVLTFPEHARANVSRARAHVDRLAAGGDEAPNVYGVNTGFGALAETRIGKDDVRTLQRNLLRSHACGVGPDLPPEIVRAMIALRAQVLALGHSGVRPVVIE